MKPTNFSTRLRRMTYVIAGAALSMSTLVAAQAIYMHRAYVTENGIQYSPRTVTTVLNYSCANAMGYAIEHCVNLGYVDCGIVRNVRYGRYPYNQCQSTVRGYVQTRVQRGPKVQLHKDFVGTSRFWGSCNLAHKEARNRCTSSGATGCHEKATRNGLPTVIDSSAGCVVVWTGSESRITDLKIPALPGIENDDESKVPSINAGLKKDAPSSVVPPAFLRQTKDSALHAL